MSPLHRAAAGRLALLADRWALAAALALVLAGCLVAIHAKFARNE